MKKTREKTNFENIVFVQKRKLEYIVKRRKERKGTKKLNEQAKGNLLWMVMYKK